MKYIFYTFCACLEILHKDIEYLEFNYFETFYSV